MRALLIPLCSVVLAAGAARGARPCAELPNPVVLQVGDTQEPLLKHLGRALADSTTTPMTLIYVTSGSCTNIEAIRTNLPISANPKYVPSAVEDPAWSPSSPSPTCLLGAGEALALDVANSALFVSSCTTDPLPADVKALPGPVQAYGFVVPEASTQVAITAEEAYFAFGFGEAGGVTPWNDETQMFIRPVTKSTLLTLAASIGVPGGRWRGVSLDASSQVLNAVATSTSPERAIGILGAEIYDAHRDTVNLLAFRGFGQRYAYFPDSTATGTDKKNVRDGHYLPWSPTVWLTRMGAQGAPLSPRAEQVVRLILGLTTTVKPDFDPIAIVAARGLIPDCAMGVSRDFDGGPLSLYAPAEPCACAFEAFATPSTASCAVCDASNPCAAGACRNGFCEER